ncbi:HK97 gp10 family phage protein [Sporolactobacillus nakayamae]|uniref:Phage protein, HK97 gp10 family n=1 Tax=Sporolactobacillus nakayamae TaxID=269670 RepID=A0A1I2PAE2_9BACL|nr:HK97 gp10 family phage protein [Sporolactobacillus nakayamae]SFG10616.1 phage protein, HK97 gp10 family [Sporolactobacillus nakayamae]
MTKSIDVSIDGVEVTLKAIKLFDMDTKAKLIDIVKASAVNLQKNAMAKAPIAKTTITKGKGKRGDLRKSIRPKYFDGGLSATVVPRKPKGSHRHLVEYGTVSRRTKKGANRGAMPRMPFMGPAEREEDAAYNAKVKGVVDRDETV